MVILYDLIVKMASGDQGGRMDKKYRAARSSMMRRDMATNLHRRHMPDGRIKEGISPRIPRKRKKRERYRNGRKKIKHSLDYWTRWRSRSGKTRVRLWMQALSRNC